MSFLEKNLFKFIKKPSDSPIKINPDDLGRLESKFEFKMPDEFKELYLFFNQYYLHPDFTNLDTELVDMLDKTKYKTTIEVQGFYFIDTEHLGDPTYVNLLPRYYPADEHFDEDDEEEGWDKNKKNDYMMFGGANGGNDELLIGIGEKNYGQVFLWRFGYTEDVNPMLIANSVSELIDGLHT